MLKGLLKYYANPRDLKAGLETSFNHLIGDFLVFERYIDLMNIQIFF